MREPLFKVSNHHTAACVEPPAVEGDAAGAYFGYFTNEYGEQAIYTYDYETGEATIRMGDAGWHEAYRVADGRPEGSCSPRPRRCGCAPAGSPPVA